MPYSYNKAGLPLLNYETTIWQFCVCHDTPNSRPGVQSRKLKKGLFWDPQVLPSLELSQSARTGGVVPPSTAHPAPLTGLLFFPRERWCSRSCLPESALTIYMVPMGSLGFPVFPGLSWSLGCPLSSTPGSLVQMAGRQLSDPWVCLKTDLAGGHQTSWLLRIQLLPLRRMLFWGWSY